MHEAHWHSPFLRPNSADYADMYADGFVNVVGASGLGAFSVTAVARWCNLSRQALLQQAGGRGRFIDEVCARLGRRWLQWSVPWSLNADLPVALPVTDEEVAGVRSWFALQELARGEWCAGQRLPAMYISQAVARDRERLAEALAERVSCDPAHLDVGGLNALVAGVRLAMVAVIDPLSPEAGEALIRSGVEGVVQNAMPMGGAGEVGGSRA